MLTAEAALTCVPAFQCWNSAGQRAIEVEQSMAFEEAPIDSPVGHIWNGVSSLALTTIGRRSGKPRRTMLFYGEDGERLILVASQGGADQHPLWYLNMLEQPEVEVQVRSERFRARARTATPEEKPRLWRMMADLYPPYDDYQAKTRRDIPVVILERI
jgi:deazaflavin-dependent oxidoreductase (nitroreductase family)